MLREGCDLFGSFNMCDYLSWISLSYVPFCIIEHCLKLVPRVSQLVKLIISEHWLNDLRKMCDNRHFVNVFPLLNGHKKLQEDSLKNKALQRQI